MESGKKNPFDLETFLRDHRSAIIQTWIEKLTTEVEQYASRPLDELKDTITEVVDANFQVLISGNHEPLDDFIDMITALRMETGFLLSDVQKAFEYYRTILAELLLENAVPADDLQSAFKKMNLCLGYATHRFSDHFQAMHEKEIREQNKLLEQMVKKRTAALEESEKKYKTLVEEINDGYFVIQDDVIVFANPAFCRMHGYERKDVLGKRLTDFVSSADRKRVVEIYSNLSDKKENAQAFGYRRLVRSKKALPTEIHGKTTSYDHKISHIGICRDMTERVRLERKIRENERMAYIGQITASLSHEIRNPMSAVKLNLQILKKNPLITGYDGRRVDLSLSEIVRLEQILNELLGFAKPLQLQKNYFNLSGLINDYIEMLDAKFSEKDLLVTTEFDGNNHQIWADKNRIGQAIINLLINAFESSRPSNRINVRYFLEYKGQTGFAWIVVEDEGSGIDEKDKKNLFKPFFTTKTKGAGLGLANVKRIIDAHNGAVFAENKDTQGAAFSLMIPTKILASE